MKQTNTLILLAGIFISFGFSSLNENGKVHQKVFKEENGEISVFEKVYANMETLDSDEGLKDFDDLVKDWANNHSKGIFIKKRIDLNAGLTWVTDEDENNAENGKHMVIKKKTGIDEFTAVETEKIMVFKTRTYKESDVKHTININIEEENGEEFIEINIKRTRNQSVKISQNLKEDYSLYGIDYFVKNDLYLKRVKY